jgi:L-alanine-DL-glutamate epimerase-like enolase superfamily enzyme
MKITNVETIYIKEKKIEKRTDGSQDALLVKITTDSGIIGWGEVDSCPVVADAIINAPYSHKLVDGLKNIIVGENPLEIESLWDKMYQNTIYYGRNGAVIHAMAGIDIALWDIKGKFLNLPLYELMGGCFVDKMRVYSSNMFQFTIEDTLKRVQIAMDTGHTAVKFGWEPFGFDEELDLEYVEGIRNTLGNDLDFMLDVGLVWDAKTTVKRAKAYEPYNLFWIEEPLHPDNYHGYGIVSDKCIQHIAAGEEECSINGFKNLIDLGNIDIVQIDVTRCGLTQAKKIADYANLLGKKVCNHNFTTDINSAASLHFLCSIPNSLVMEYCQENGEISRKLCSNPVKIKDGFAHLPTEPGLGVIPNNEIIEKYRA